MTSSFCTQPAAEQVKAKGCMIASSCRVRIHCCWCRCCCAMLSETGLQKQPESALSLPLLLASSPFTVIVTFGGVATPGQDTWTLCPLFATLMLLPLLATTPSSYCTRCSVARSAAAAAGATMLIGDCSFPVVQTQGLPEPSTPTQSSPAPSTAQKTTAAATHR